MSGNRPDLHTSQHDQWDQGGYCNNLVVDDDGSGTVCGYHAPSNYTPSLEALRREFEYRIRTAVAFGIGRGKPGDDMGSQQKADWIQHEIDKAMASLNVAGVIEAVRAEVREKAAQIAEDSYEDQPTWLRNGIARLIREQGKEQGS